MDKFNPFKEASVNKKEELSRIKSFWDNFNIEIPIQERVTVNPFNPELFLKGRFSFVFSGQGTHPPLEKLRETTNDQEFVLADEIARGGNLHENLRQVLLNCTQDEYQKLLTDTGINQIVVYTYQQVLYRQFCLSWEENFGEKSPSPINTTGNSLGIYNAYTAAQAFNFSDGLNLIVKRGLGMRLASKAYPDVESRIISGLPTEIIEYLRRHLNFLISNYNSPTQLVFGGNKLDLEDVDTAINELVDQLCDDTNTNLHIQELKSLLAHQYDINSSNIREKIKIIKSKIGGVFHSEYMRPAHDIFDPAVSKIPIHKTDVSVVPDDGSAPKESEDDIRSLLKEHITRSVRFPDTIRRLETEAMIVFGGKESVSNFCKEIMPVLGENIIHLSSKPGIEAFIKNLSNESQD